MAKFDPVLISIIRRTAPIDFANSIISGVPMLDMYELAVKDYHTIVEYGDTWARFKYPTIPTDVIEWCIEVGIKFETFTKDQDEYWFGKIAFDSPEALDMFLLRWR